MKFNNKRWLLGYFVACACLCASAHVHAGEWPVIALPPRVSSFEVGEQFTSNGMPMRVQGFLSQDMHLTQAVEWFRRSMGQPLVESKNGQQLVLGRAQGGFYLTVQLQALHQDGRAGLKGLVAVSDVAGFHAHQARHLSDVRRWLDRWPTGTQEITRMTSHDVNKTTLHVALRNGHSEELNREALIDLLRQDGYVLEREVSATGLKHNTGSSLSGGGKAFYFKGSAKEAMATIVKTEQGKTDVVLNTTTYLEPFKK